MIIPNINGKMPKNGNQLPPTRHALLGIITIHHGNPEKKPAKIGAKPWLTVMVCPWLSGEIPPPPLWQFLPSSEV